MNKDYAKPALTRHGTFRDMTRIGLAACGDSHTVLGATTGDPCRS